jgi:hypothetical protein
VWILASLFCLLLTSGSTSASSVPIPNASFETDTDHNLCPDSWIIENGGGAKVVIESTTSEASLGKSSIHMRNETPLKPFVFGSILSDPFPASPATTYKVHFDAKGRHVSQCYLAIIFVGDGDHRCYLPPGDFEWCKFTFLFTTPLQTREIRIRFATDDVTNDLWIDDVSIEIGEKQFSNLTETTFPRSFPGAFPRSQGSVAPSLAVYDTSADPREISLSVSALQGLVNRRDPGLYVIHSSNPTGMDEEWLRYMKEKKYTGLERKIGSFEELISFYRNSIKGVIIYDEAVPGSIHAACMIGGLKNALPVSPALSEKLGLPVVMDLRGKWKTNVEAYRYVYENHFAEMNHHILAWMHPLSVNQAPRDYMVEFNVFTFWLSKYGDDLKGADPGAEEEFLNELLASTPANIPVMGWPAYQDVHGIQEYTGVRLLSEYGKYVPGTEFCSNMSVHTAIHPPDAIFNQTKQRQQPKMELDPKRIYLTLNILDSGDGLWYWQFYQRKVWADSARGSVPIGWCLNVTLYDTLPLIMQWYYENATPNDSFFAAISGLGYMNTQVYATRFRDADRTRIWQEYIRLTDEYCQKTGIDGIEIYNGSWGEPTPPTPGLFGQYVKGMKNLDYILADLGRHANINPSNSNYLVGQTAVFHTLTQFRVWASSDDAIDKSREEAVRWLAGEITQNAPHERPGFMSGMAISWSYFPSWIQAVSRALPDDYTLVSPWDLARLYRESLQGH